MDFGKNIFKVRRNEYMNTLYLLCELGDEHYTEPVFTVFQHQKEAFVQKIMILQ